MDTQAVLGNHGAPFRIEWRGVKYQLSYRVQRVKAEFERWAKEREVRKLLRFKPAMADEDYQKRLDALLDRIDGEEFAFNSPRCRKLLAEPEGATAMFRILLGKDGEKLTEEELIEFFAEKGDEVAAFTRAQTSRVDRIKRDLGWTPESDPDEENIDPKALALALAKEEML